MSKRVLVIGSANIDFVLSADKFPVAGETIIADGTYSYIPGGKGANAAVAAARLGGEVVFCTRVGDDAYGDRLSKIYAENGIDRRFVKVDPTEQTGLAVVMVEGGGQNRIIVFPGANKSIGESDIESSFLTYPDIAVTNLEISSIAVELASRLAEKDRVPFVLDCGGVSRGFTLKGVKCAEIVSPNEIETEILTGIRPDSLDNCLKACIKLCNLTAIKYAVLKLGARGSYIYDGKYCDICGPYEVDAVDSTAAGDAFTSALALEYSRNGGDIYSACRYANAVGALTVTRRGAISSLPTEGEVRVFMSEHMQI